jgi:microcystin-dependent protein
MAEPFLGQISMFGFNFAPSGWALCNGQIMAISQNTALFALLGTTYGGDGVTTFALPNLQSRVPLHWGQGPGLSTYDIGEVTGVENVTLISPQIPAHTHVAVATVNAAASALAPTDDPTGGVPCGGSGQNIYAPAPDNTTKMNAGMVGVVVQPAGGSQPHSNIQPILAITFCIALQGVFPSRN